MSHSVSGPTETSELSNLTADFPDEVDLRLVVADMDGTLLDGQGRVPRRLDTVVARMHEHGVVFAPASGRQLANLRATLGTTITQSPIIAENGMITEPHGHDATNRACASPPRSADRSHAAAGPTAHTAASSRTPAASCHRRQ